MSSRTLKRMLDDFYPYAKDYLGFDKDASISFESDEANANKPLGKTAHYDPAAFAVTVYTDNRHPKDIMRSVSHELVHHAQNCRGDLGMSEQTGEGYAQNNEHLRNMEREAYEKGNLCFRDWEDGIKSNMEPGTIYESRARRSKKSMNNFKTLSENFKSFLQQEGNEGYEAGDVVKDLRNDTVGTVVEPMAGGAVVKLEDGTIVKTRDKFLEKVEGDPSFPESGMELYDIDENKASGLAEYGAIDAQDGNPPSKIGQGDEAYMTAYNAVLVARGEEPLPVVQPDQAYLDALQSGNMKPSDHSYNMKESGTDWHAREQMEKEIINVLQSDPSDGFSVDDIIAELPNDIIHGKGNIEAVQGALEDMVGDGQLEVDGIGMYSLAVQGSPMQEGSSEPKQGDDVVVMAGGLTGAAGEVMELTTSTQGEPAVVIYLSKDADKRVMGQVGDEVIALVSDVQVDSGIQGGGAIDRGAMEEPEDDSNWVGHSAHYQEGVDITEEYNGHLWESKLNKIINMAIKEYGDHETQAQGGMVSSSHSSDPELDQIADIVRTVIEGGGGLHDLKQPLEAEAFDVQSTSQYVLVKTTSGDIAIASSKNVELAGDEELIDTPYGQLAVGRINQGMEEGFRGSPEEKEMTSKMSNKEFSDYHTRDKHIVPDLKGDMGPLDGMEGPFQYASGAVLYYDTKAGKYYDRGSDRYLDNEEAAKLTMENNQMKLKNNLREKVKASVVNRLKEMYDDDDPYADDDPYMSGLEAEFPWLADKKKGAPVAADAAAAEAAAAADAEAAGEFAVAPEEEEEEDTTVMREDGEDFASSLRARVTKRLQELSKGQEEMDLDDDGKIEPEDLAGLRSGKEDEDVGEEAEEKEKNESLRDKVYRIVQETLGGADETTNTINEDTEKATKEVAKSLNRLQKSGRLEGMSPEEMQKEVLSLFRNLNLMGVGSSGSKAYVKMSPEEQAQIFQSAAAQLQESKSDEEDDGFIYATDKKRAESEKNADDARNAYKPKNKDESDEDKNEGKKYKREADDEDEEDDTIDESEIAANPEDFFRKLRNESRTIKNDNWNDSHKSKRSSMLNERLMSSWFNK